MANDVNLRSASVSENSFYESSQIGKVLLGMRLVLSAVFVARAPCCDIHFALLVAISREVLNRLGEPSEEINHSHCDI